MRLPCTCQPTDLAFDGPKWPAVEQRPQLQLRIALQSRILWRVSACSLSRWPGRQMQRKHCIQVTAIARLSVPAVVAPGPDLQIFAVSCLSFHSCNVLSEFSLGPGRHQRCLLRYRESGRRPDVGVAKKVLTSLLDRTRHPALLPVFHQQPLLNFSMDRQNKRCKQVGMFHHREAWMPALQYMLPSRAHAQSVTQTYRRHAYRLRGVLNSAQVVQATRARTAEMPEFGIRGATKTCCTF